MGMFKFKTCVDKTITCKIRYTTQAWASKKIRHQQKIFKESKKNIYFSCAGAVFWSFYIFLCHFNPVVFESPSPLVFSPVL